MGRSTHRQVKAGSMRDTLAGLQKDGWTIETTNGGHIRLERPGVPNPIIAPKTASDHRAALNVRAVCRKALKLSAEAKLMASTTPQRQVAPSHDLPLLQDPSRRRKARWSAERARQALVAQVQAAAPIPSEIAALRILTEGPTVGEAVASLQSLSDGFEDTVSSAAPSSEGPSDEHQSGTGLPETIAARAAQILAPASRRGRTSATVERKEPIGAAPAPLPLVDPAAMDLAMKILSGQMQRLEITADMVGMTLAYQGEIVVVGATPVARLVAAPVPNTGGDAPAPHHRQRLQPAATRVDRTGSRHAEVRRIALAALGTLSDWVSNQDLSDLIHGEAGYQSARSMAGMLAAVLDGLRREGRLETRHEQVGRALRAFHRARAA